MKIHSILQYHPRGAIRYAQGAFALLILFGLLVLFRLSSLMNPRVINVDEAELIATGRLSAANLTPYLEYATSTSIFIQPFSLGLLGRLGTPLNLVTAHVLAGLLYVTLIYAMWIVTSRRFGWLRSGFLMAPAAIVVFSGSLFWDNPDFLSLSTELIPLVLIVFASLVLSIPDKKISTWRFAIAAIIAGFVPWAKPQLTLLAISLVVVGTLSAIISIGRLSIYKTFLKFLRWLGLGIAAFTLPTLLILTWLWAVGTLESFIGETLQYNFSYVVDRESYGGARPSFSNRIASVGDVMLKSSIALTWASIPLLLFSELQDKEKKSHWLLAAIWLIPLLSAFLTLLFVFPIFTHYINIFFGACLLSAILSTKALWQKQNQVEPVLVPVGVTTLFIFLIFLALTASVSAMRDSVFLLINREQPRTLWSTSEEVASRDLTLRSCPPGSHVLVWGWASELYSYYGWMPGSRYVNPSVWQRRAPTILREVESSPPACIVEASDGQFFPGLSTSLEAAIPELAPLLDTCYEEKALPLIDARNTKVYELNDNCAHRQPFQRDMSAQ